MSLRGSLPLGGGRGERFYIMNSILEQDIMYLSGVGPKRKDLLSKELGLNTWRDLLEYYPYKYVDRSRIYTINEMDGNMPFVQIKGRILSFEEFAQGARRKRVVAHFSDGTGVVDLVWFRGAQYIYAISLLIQR